MKTLWIMPLSAGAILASALMAAALIMSSAQMSSAQDNPNTSVTIPEKVGSAAAQSSAATNPEAAQNQPWMATGEDLKGPPQRFPAGQTPE
jgi:hypothetical protein